MKIKPIAVIISVILLVSLFALICFAVISSNSPKLNFVMSIPYEEIEIGDVFSVEFKLSNANVKDFLISGMQIELLYDNDLMMVSEVITNNDVEASQIQSHFDENRISFVTVKNTFSDIQGYEVLGDIFKVKFKALKDIQSPAGIFTKENVKIIPGDTLSNFISRYTLSVFLKGAPTAAMEETVGKPGETVELTIRLNDIENVRKITLKEFEFYSTALSLISAEYTGDTEADFVFNPEMGCTLSFDSPINLTGETVKLKFKIDENTPDGAYTVSFIANADYSASQNDLQTVSGIINVKNVIRGDVNGDNTTDADDAIHLLYTVLFGETDYPVNQVCDFDGNGTVNADDAIYLLYHVLFGETDYPLA